ncbi:MAG TPA: hypothetical protein VJN70_07360, partial [Gemmatimonadaceae bacterium]|nr:hypothetical protein [Gemmatimonadaceae bacterium]
MAQVLDWRLDRDLGLLHQTAIDDGHRTKRAVAAAAEEACDLVERSLRRRESDSLRTVLAQLLQTLESEREVHAALCSGNCVDFV